MSKIRLILADDHGIVRAGSRLLLEQQPDIEVRLSPRNWPSNKEAAAILDVSPYTVETHRMHVMQKLNLHNTAEIVLYAVRKKIVS